jgi:hypothetical protein
MPRVVSDHLRFKKWSSIVYLGWCFSLFEYLFELNFDGVFIIHSGRGCIWFD